MQYHHIVSDSHRRYFCSLFLQWLQENLSPILGVTKQHKMNVRSISISELIYSEAPFTEQHAIALLQVYFLGYKITTFTHKRMCVPKSQK